MIKRMINFMTLIVVIAVISVPAKIACSQEAQDLLGQVSQRYTTNDVSTSGILGNFSMVSLIASIFFGFIGFLAFTYGKKRSEFRPMMIGILLMVFPYFVKSTVIMCLVGILLTSALYFFRY